MSVHDVRPYPEECRRVREMLGAREDGPLAPGEEVLLRDHLDECEECQTVASWMPSIDALAHGIGGMQAPDASYFARVRTSVMTQVQAASQEPPPASARPFWRRWPVLAPAALVVAAVGLFTLRQSERTEVIDAFDVVTEVKQSPPEGAILGEESPEDRGKNEGKRDTPAQDPTPADLKEGSRLGAASTPAVLETHDADEAVPVDDEAVPVAEKITVFGGRSSPMATSPARMEAEELLTVGHAFELAVASQDTPDEAPALSRLLDLLEAETAREAVREPQSTPSERAQTLDRRLRQSVVSVPVAQADSIATHLQVRRTVLDDDALRARIDAWLKSR